MEPTFDLDVAFHAGIAIVAGAALFGYLVVILLCFVTRRNA